MNNYMCSAGLHSTYLIESVLDLHQFTFSVLLQFWHPIFYNYASDKTN